MDVKNKMATRKTKITPIADYFGVDHQAYHMKGKNCRDLFSEEVNDFFTRMDHNLYVTGQPGVGKTYQVENSAPNFPKIYLLTIKQKTSPWAFMKSMAVNLHNLPKGMKLAVYIDDINSAAAPGYAILNIRGGFEQQLSNWKVSEYLRIENILDRSYIGAVRVNDNSNRNYEAAAGRNWLMGLSASYRF